MMAAAAKFRDESLGQPGCLRTSTAYTVASNQSFDTLAHMDKAIFCIVQHTNSGASPSQCRWAWGQAAHATTGVAVASGALKSGTPYVAVLWAIGEPSIVPFRLLHSRTVAISMVAMLWGTRALFGKRSRRWDIAFVAMAAIPALWFGINNFVLERRFGLAELGTLAVLAIAIWHLIDPDICSRSLMRPSGKA
jgi:hypothetical protein